MSNGYAISNWQDAKTIYAKLAKLTSQPIYSVSDEELKRVLDHFETKCAKSKEITTEAKKYIPGGVQHNLAFNYPFPLVFTKADGMMLYDIDGNEYFDFLQAGGPTVLGSNPKVVRDQVIDLLNTCGPSTGLFHEYEYKLGKKISELIPNVDMFRMLQSGTEACMLAARIARLATKNKNIVKKSALEEKVAEQANKDVLVITGRADFRVSMLETERDMAEYRFGASPRPTKRRRKAIGAEIARIKQWHKQAVRLEEADISSGKLRFSLLGKIV